MVFGASATWTDLWWASCGRGAWQRGARRSCPLYEWYSRSLRFLSKIPPKCYFIWNSTQRRCPCWEISRKWTVSARHRYLCQQYAHLETCPLSCWLDRIDHILQKIYFRRWWSHQRSLQCLGQVWHELINADLAKQQFWMSAHVFHTPIFDCFKDPGCLFQSGLARLETRILDS